MQEEKNCSQSPGEAFERQDSAVPGATFRLLDCDQECLESTVSAAKCSSIVCLDGLLHPLYQVFDFCQCKHSHRVFLTDLGGDPAVLFCKRIWSETRGERQVFARGNGWSRCWCSRWGLVGYRSHHVFCMFCVFRFDRRRFIFICHVDDNSTSHTRWSWQALWQKWSMWRWRNNCVRWFLELIFLVGLQRYSR